MPGAAPAGSVTPTNKTGAGLRACARQPAAERAPEGAGRWWCPGAGWWCPGADRCSPPRAHPSTIVRPSALTPPAPARPGWQQSGRSWAGAWGRRRGMPPPTPAHARAEGRGGVRSCCGKLGGRFKLGRHQHHNRKKHRTARKHSTAHHGAAKLATAVSTEAAAAAGLVAGGAVGGHGEALVLGGTGVQDLYRTLSGPRPLPAVHLWRGGGTHRQGVGCHQWLLGGEDLPLCWWSRPAKAGAAARAGPWRCMPRPPPPRLHPTSTGACRAAQQGAAAAAAVAAAVRHRHHITTTATATTPQAYPSRTTPYQYTAPPARATPYIAPPAPPTAAHQRRRRLWRGPGAAPG